MQSKPNTVFGRLDRLTYLMDNNFPIDDPEKYLRDACDARQTLKKITSFCYDILDSEDIEKENLADCLGVILDMIGGEI